MPTITVATDPGQIGEPLGATLDRSLIQGIAWTGVAKWGTQLLTWLSTLVVARLLSPEDYGLVGMATIYLGLLTLVTEFGLGSAVMILRDLREREVAQLNTLSVFLGVAGFALSWAAAVPLGRFFDAPELPAVVLVLSFGFVITGFRTVPQALLQRDLRFKRLAAFESVQALVLAAAMITFAVLGLRYWTLVIGGLLSASISTALMVASRPQRFARPRLDSLRSAVRLSGHILVSRLAWYVYSNADFLVAAKILGKASLGAYSFAWTLAHVPVDKISALIGRVTPAFFSAVQTDPAALRRYLLTITEGLAFITLPITFGLALTADDLVPLVLGEQWLGMIAPLQILALYASFLSLFPLLPQILTVVGESRFGMWNGVAAAVILPLAFWVASRWGTVGIAAAWVLVHPVVVLPVYVRVFRKIELPAIRYLKAVWPALSGSVVMAGAVLIVDAALGPAFPPWADLGLQIACGIAVYLAVTAILHRARLVAFRRVATLARG